ncbi:MAG: peptidoglycan bridge formation glycyltransferase FemA/FemB family protein [Anaerolineales bacterium]|nr:peptidoglycan bridge formation glycyltransferase FemA/FemB family protein [Anaerolineales bacterium]
MQNNIWNSIISKLPNPHFLQSYEWGQVKAKYGWVPYYAVWGENGEFHITQDSASLSSFVFPIIASALVLKRTVSFRGLVKASVLYSPKGPLLDWTNESLRTRVLNDLQSFAKKQKAIFLKIDPDVELGRGVPASEGDVVDGNGQAVMAELKRRRWGYSSDQIQFQNTVLIHLNQTEEVMLARMKPKTRYNTRLAEKKGVSVRVGTQDDLPPLYKMYAETSVRDGFVIRDEEYYLNVWKIFMSNVETLKRSNVPTCFPLIAEVDGEAVAAIFLFMFGKRAYYVYGMSRNAHREKMPTYLLQWEAMKIAKSNGCDTYDLWGAPEIFDESDSMWGVYRFKEGLGGEVVRTLGAYDFAPNKILYKLYAEVMPRVLNFMRSRGKEKTKQSLGGA